MAYSKNKIIRQLRQITLELGLKCEKIILFGSRAEKNHHRCSDWDFLLITKEVVPENEKRALKAKIRVAMHDHFPTMLLDIVMIDNTLFLKEKNIINTISNEAFHSGIMI
ncbi:MAG: nucleotidyltransferase domain-containing protein [bacterium]